MKKTALILFTALALFLSIAAHANWYEGGTLHDASALEWQQATDANKLATAGDLFATLIKNGHLNPDVSRQVNDISDLRRFSQELANQLDDAFEPDPDPDQNQRLFANQNVNTHAALLMSMMGWIKN